MELDETWTIIPNAIVVTDLTLDLDRSLSASPGDSDDDSDISDDGEDVDGDGAVETVAAASALVLGLSTGLELGGARFTVTAQSPTADPASSGSAQAGGDWWVSLALAADERISLTTLIAWSCPPG